MQAQGEGFNYDGVTEAERHALVALCLWLQQRPGLSAPIEELGEFYELRARFDFNEAIGDISVFCARFSNDICVEDDRVRCLHADVTTLPFRELVGAVVGSIFESSVTSQPNITAAMTDMLVTAELEVNCSNYLPELEQRFPDLRHHLVVVEGLDNRTICKLLRERRRQIAHDVKEHLFSEDVHENFVNDTIRNSARRGYIPRDIPLYYLARQCNTTTSLLAKVLCGVQRLNAASEAIEGNTSDDFVNAAGDDYRERLLRSCAVTAHQISHRDNLTGHTISRGNNGQQNMQTMREFGNQAEQCLINMLGQALLPQSWRLTEAQQQQQEQEGQQIADPEPAAASNTPDVLLTEPIELFGNTVHWIEVKSAAMMPGVTPQQRIDQMQEQIGRYVAALGPGAIFWHKRIQHERLADVFGPDVLHFHTAVLP